MVLDNFSQDTFESILASEIDELSGAVSTQGSTGSNESNSTSSSTPTVISSNRSTSEPRAKSWCFTWHDYTDEDVALLRRLQADRVCTYVIFGHEVCPETGRPHLQGYIMFNERKRFSQVKRLTCNHIHLEVTRMVKNAIEYCKKDGKFEEHGIPPPDVKGKVCHLNDFKLAVKSGNFNEVQLRENFSIVWARYRQFCEQYLRDNEPKKKIDAHPLLPWQQDLNSLLMLPPDDRKITFVVDIVGNKGKSWFAHYYCSLHSNAQVMTPGRYQDMAMILKANSRVIFLDAPRSKQGDFIQYTFLENLKDGYILCSKYMSCMKTLDKVHVVVLMNEHPDMTKLSQDRYNVIELA